MNTTKRWFLGRGKRSLLPWLGILAIALSGCTTVPVTGRQGLNLVSTSQEVQLGLSSFEQLKQETPISKDPQMNAALQRVGMQIAKVATKDMPEAQWEFVVFESQEPNAFCLPGGKVGVYTGIFPIAKTEAGLATVIGHEVAHATARHGAERMSRQMVLAGGQEVVKAGVGTRLDPASQQLALMAYGLGAQVGLELPFSRAQELEADRIGLTYMARAGYDPAQAVEFWQRFSELDKGGDSTPAFLRTHPMDKERIQDLKKWLPEAEAEFARSSVQK